MVHLQVKEDNKIFDLDIQIKDRLGHTDYHSGEIESMKERIDQLIQMVAHLSCLYIAQNYSIMSDNDLKPFIGYGHRTELLVDGHARPKVEDDL